jgi:LEA14-like dessication related protein
MKISHRASLRFVSPAALLLMLAGCQSIDDLLKSAPKPSARVTDARLQDIGLDQVGLLFDVEVRNPYTVALPLAELRYAIGSSGQRIVDGTVTPGGSIPASGTKLLQVPAKVELRSLLAALKGVRPGSVVPYTAELNLGVNAPMAGRLDLPFSHHGELPVPAAPEVHLVALDIAAVSLDKVAATGRLRLKNSNAFDLDLRKLGFNLALGGKDVGRTGLANAASLAPGESRTIDVPVSFSPRALGAGLFNVLRGSQAGYAVSGSIEAGTRFGPLALPFKASGNVPISR